MERLGRDLEKRKLGREVGLSDGRLPAWEGSLRLIVGGEEGLSSMSRTLRDQASMPFEIAGWAVPRFRSRHGAGRSARSIFHLAECGDPRRHSRATRHDALDGRRKGTDSPMRGPDPEEPGRAGWHFATTRTSPGGRQIEASPAPRFTFYWRRSAGRSAAAPSSISGQLRATSISPRFGRRSPASRRCWPDQSDVLDSGRRTCEKLLGAAAAARRTRTSSRLHRTGPSRRGAGERRIQAGRYTKRRHIRLRAIASRTQAGRANVSGS